MDDDDSMVYFGGLFLFGGVCVCLCKVLEEAKLKSRGQLHSQVGVNSSDNRKAGRSQGQGNSRQVFRAFVDTDSGCSCGSYPEFLRCYWLTLFSGLSQLYGVFIPLVFCILICLGRRIGDRSAPDTYTVPYIYSTLII